MKRYDIGIGGALIEAKDGTLCLYKEVDARIESLCKELKERDDKIQALEGLLESINNGEVPKVPKIDMPPELLCTICNRMLDGHVTVVAHDTNRRAHMTCWIDAGHEVIWPGLHGTRGKT
jgi:hypothetical protein